MSLIIKHLGPEDLESALVVAGEFIRTEDNWYVDKWFQIENYQNIFFNPESGFDTFVARFENVAGFIIGKPLDERIYEIRHHYVLKNYRQQGIAKKLKQRMTEYASDKGYRVIHSTVSAENNGSIRLNQALSWDCLPIPGGYLFYKRLPLAGNAYKLS
jgi:L-amino acid N-acyltransferase YncA